MDYVGSSNYEQIILFRMISNTDRDALKIVIESRGISPLLKKSLKRIYEQVGGNIDDLRTSTGKNTGLPSQGDQGDTYKYRVRRGEE